jgi:hypothetical protein
MKRPAKSERYGLLTNGRASPSLDNLRPAIFSVCFTGAQPGGRVAGH